MQSNETGSAPTRLTISEIDSVQRIGRDEQNRSTTIALGVLDALCETARAGAVDVINDVCDLRATITVLASHGYTVEPRGLAGLVDALTKQAKARIDEGAACSGLFPLPTGQSASFEAATPRPDAWVDLERWLLERVRALSAALAQACDEIAEHGSEYQHRTPASSLAEWRALAAGVSETKSDTLGPYRMPTETWRIGAPVSGLDSAASLREKARADYLRTPPPKPSLAAFVAGLADQHLADAAVRVAEAGVPIDGRPLKGWPGILQDVALSPEQEAEPLGKVHRDPISPASVAQQLLELAAHHARLRNTCDACQVIDRYIALVRQP